MAYQCKDCPYKTDDRSNFLRHFKNRASCVLDLDELKAPRNLKFQCRNEGCESVFSSMSSRSRHEKKCSSKISGNSMSNVSSGGHSAVTVGDHNSIDNSVNNSVNNNVNVTIHINAFDDFKPTEISRQKFLEYMASGATNVILKCLESEQFNLNKPENMNVFISNLKDKIARVYDGYRWRVRDGDDVVDQVLDNYVDMVNESIEEFEDTEETNQALATKISRWRKNVDKQEFENHVKHRLTQHLYDFRSLVKDTHNVKQR